MTTEARAARSVRRVPCGAGAALLFAGVLACTPDADPRTGTRDVALDDGAPIPEAREHPCPDGYAAELRCSTVDVAENPDAPNGRQLGLTVVVAPGTDSHNHSVPVFVLAGGPGQAVTDGLERWTPDHGQQRDVVFVDQRGAGGSNGLYCDLYGGDPAAALASWLPPDAVRRCRAELEERADLRLYTTTLAARDLEAVRRALGYEQIHLDASSYGTRLAQAYIRAYPDRVRAALLRGVTGVEDRIPLDFAADTQRALDLLLELCAADPECDVRFPDPAADLARALRRLDAGPVTVSVETPEDGTVETFLPRFGFSQSLRYHLYGSPTARRIPLLLERAAAGDFDAFAQFLLGFRRNFERTLAFGLLFSVTCSEDLPFIAPEEARRRADGTFLGLDRYSEQAAACRQWPRGEVPVDLHEPVRSDVPILMISGELDPATPPEDAEWATRHFSRRQHLVVAGGSHFGAAGAPCVRELIEELWRSADPHAIDGSDCLAGIEQPPFDLTPRPARSANG